MRSNAMKNVRWTMLLAVGLMLLEASHASAATATIGFQNGINGYNGTFDRRIHEAGEDNEFDGSTVAATFVDGFADGSSPDQQVLIRFDDIIGDGPNQIPTGATILDAELQIRSSNSGSADSPGPWGVARLLQPFDSSTRYFDDFECTDCGGLGSRGPWWEDGYATRPIPSFEGLVEGQLGALDIQPFVQSWVDGEPNHGVTIQAGFPAVTANGWGVLTTGNPRAENRPKLSVTYTTDPVSVTTVQQGLDGYSGSTMARVQSGDNVLGTPEEPDFTLDDVTTDGSTLDQSFLDGINYSNPDGITSSPDQLALIRFDDVFGSDSGQAPADTPVAKAWLAITSGSTSDNARSVGEWAVNPVLREWDTTTLYSDFGSEPGLQEHDGDIGANLDRVGGILHGAQVWFDVTDYLEGVRNGETDNGLAVRSTATSDGWQIHFNGSEDQEFRPRLTVISGNTGIVEPGLDGDFNGDGVVGAADYVAWRDSLGSDSDLNGNGNEDGASAGVVDQADYELWMAGFGNTGNNGGVQGSAVPEPNTAVLALLIGLVFAAGGVGRR